MDGFTINITDEKWKITVTSKRGCWVKDMWEAALPVVVEKDADWRPESQDDVFEKARELHKKWTT